jgi:hypothetical protein
MGEVIFITACLVSFVGLMGLVEGSVQRLRIMQQRKMQRSAAFTQLPGHSVER